MWEIESGRKFMQLQNAHETQEITALTFDPEQRRLFSGARDGTIKVRPPPLLSSISRAAATVVDKRTWISSGFFY